MKIGIKICEFGHELVKNTRKITASALIVRTTLYHYQYCKIKIKHYMYAKMSAFLFIILKYFTCSCVYLSRHDTVADLNCLNCLIVNLFSKHFRLLACWLILVTKIDDKLSARKETLKYVLFFHTSEHTLSLSLLL